MFLAVLIGQTIVTGGSKSIFMIPAIMFLPVAWSLIPPPRAFKVFCLALVFMPLSFDLPFGILGVLPGFNALPFFGQVILALALALLVWPEFHQSFSTLSRSTWLGLFLFLLGGLLALIDAPNSYGVNTRWWGMQCLLPASVLFVSSTVVRNIKQAERLLGIIVTSMAVLGGLLFYCFRTGLFVSQAGSDANWLMTHGRLGGSLSVNLPVPLLGQIDMSIGNNAVQLGELVAMGIVIAFAYALGGRSRHSRWVAMIATSLLIILLVTTNSRGALIAASAGAVVVYTASLIWQSSARRFHLFAPMAVMLVGFVAASGWVQLSFGGREALDRLLELRNISSAGTWVGRSELFQEVLLLLRDNPLGVSFWGPSPSVMLNPHNLYLWVAQGTGVIGLIGFLIILGSLMTVVLRGLRHPDPRRQVLSVAALGVLVVALVAGIGSVFFQVTNITATFWAVMGLLFAVDERPIRLKT
jgi:hypothetical protein